jgi:uncharacterized coiled-coil protein SlyX
MKTLNQSKSSSSWRIPASILLLALLCAAGCRTTGYKKSDAAGRSLQKAAMEVQAETREIDVTLAALNDLVSKPEADLKPQFQRFSSALKRLTESAEQTDRTRLRMEEKSAEYFEAWDQQAAGIHYGKVREQTEARRAEVTNRFHAVNSRYLEAQAVVWPLITYFNDIRTALSVDLTAAGLDSVKDIVSNADQNARKVQTALGRLTDELTTSSTALSSTLPRNSPPPSQEAETAKVRNNE